MLNWPSLIVVTSVGILLRSPFYLMYKCIQYSWFTHVHVLPKLTHTLISSSHPYTYTNYIFSLILSHTYTCSKYFYPHTDTLILSYSYIHNLIYSYLMISLYGTPLAERASYLALHSSLFQPDSTVTYDYYQNHKMYSQW